MNSILKKSLALSAFSFLTLELCAQKPEIDSEAIKTWPTLGEAAISGDGNYVSYRIGYDLLGRSTLVIQSMLRNWRTSYEGAGNCQFSRDSRRAYFRKGDSLSILKLGEEKPERAIAVHELRHPRNEPGEWLTYEPKDEKGELILVNLSTNKKTRFDSIRGYLWEDQGRVLLMELRQGNKTLLNWVDLPALTTRQIWSTEDSVSGLLTGAARFDKEGKQVVFETLRPGKDHPSTVIWYYHQAGEQAIKLANDESGGMGPELFITGNQEFSQNGRYIFLKLQKRSPQQENPKAGAAQVDIYSYKDYVLQSQQLKALAVKTVYLAAVSTVGGPVIQLERDVDGDDRVFTRPEETIGDYIVLGEKLHADFNPWWLARTSAFTYFLVSLKDGTRACFKKGSEFPIDDFSFSPDGDWLVYWDSKTASYHSYHVQTGKTTDLTRGMLQFVAKGDFVDMFGNDLYPQARGGYNGIKWVDEGKACLINGDYDLWKIDPTGNKTPVNLTMGYGQRHDVILRLVDQEDTDSRQVLVTGFNIANKQNGFFQVSLDHAASPVLLTMGPYCYYRTGSQIPAPRLSFSKELRPVRAKDADAWIVSRQTASDFPNFYYTRDWKKFTALTDLQPQKDYNWLTSELVNYKQLDGTPSQGILYKPADFDPQKKYPVIFNYYEHLSYRLYEFPTPEYTAHNVNIPWFVSRGYLVFTPDNHYTVASAKGGKTFGETVCNSVVGAAKFLSTLPYVDAKHLGIQGHSFGGGETNFLVTHSNVFAAACSASGTTSDEISAYLGPYRPKGGFPNSYRVAHAENGHEMIGATLWERPDLYFRSSSVFNANRVTAPLLLMHNEKDEQTDWGQSFELYTALRRLGKPVWMLQYDGEGHSLGKKEDQKDFTIRMTQFFDHYLKGAPAPVWMTGGIPAKLKGIDQGYELDLSGKQP